MYHFRDTKGGDFHLDRDRLRRAADEELPLLRFARTHGVAHDLWTPSRIEPNALLADAQLNWRVRVRTVHTCPDARDSRLSEIPGYRALIRPDKDHIMSVVTTAYRVAENDSVACTAVAIARKFDATASLIGAAGFGRDQEKAIYIVRVNGTSNEALILLAFNTHGGDGAVRFHLVEADRRSGAVLTPASPHASISVPHVGDVEQRLERLARRSTVADYVSETRRMWDMLHDALWSPRHTKALLQDMWGDPPSLHPTTPDGRPLEPTEQAFLHPTRHLTSALNEYSDAANAYRRICEYLDHESEARERGDFTADRDERLALGAGMRLKQHAWKWITANI